MRLHQLCLWFDSDHKGCFDALGPLALHGVPVGTHVVHVQLGRWKDGPGSALVAVTAQLQRATVVSPTGHGLDMPTHPASLSVVGQEAGVAASPHVHSVMMMMDGVEWRLLLPLYDAPLTDSLLTSLCSAHALAPDACTHLRTYVVASMTR